MHSLFKSWLGLSLSVGLGFNAPLAQAQTLEIAGSSTVAKTIIEPTLAKAREATGLELKMLSVGTGKGMQMLFDGKVKVAAVSASLEEALEDAKKAGAGAPPAGLKLHTLVNDQLVPIAHNDNPGQGVEQRAAARTAGRQDSKLEGHRRGRRAGAGRHRGCRIRHPRCDREATDGRPSVCCGSQRAAHQRG